MCLLHAWALFDVFDACTTVFGVFYGGTEL